MRKALLAFVVSSLISAILCIPALAMPGPLGVPESTPGATILLYSDPRPGLFWPDGETALTHDFNQALNLIPPGWVLDCVQNIGDIDPVSTGLPPLYFTLDQAYAASELAGLPHFMCVGNHEAETQQDMIDIRAKFSGYPDWNLIPGPKYTSETTYSYDVGDIHVVVLNEYWDGGYNDAWFRYGGGNGGYVPDALFQWLKGDLRSSSRPYKIVVGHEPGYPVCNHVGDSLDQDRDNRDRFFNLLRTEGVIAYFTAHTHRSYLTEHDGVFEANTGACGAMVGKLGSDDFATLGYAHCDSDGFKIRMVREDPSLGWDSPSVTTVTRSDLETQILVNTADGAGTVCRYFIDYTAVAQPINPDWSAYGPWWETAFDDVGAGWSEGELGVGYDSMNPEDWGWINEAIDEDPTASGDEQVYGVFVRIPFGVYDKAAYSFMKLGVDYDDAATIWLNGTKIFESPTSPTISSTDYWDKVATGNHPANGDRALNPDFDITDITDHMSILKEGRNLLVVGNWNWGPGSSDLVAGVKLYLTKAVDLVSPDIKANGSDGPVTIPPGTNLTVTITLDPGSHNGEDADWWVVGGTPFELFWYTLDRGWVRSDAPVRVYGGPLFDLPPFEVLNISGLPVGPYTFYFGVDLLMNGCLDFGQLYYDRVDVDIE